MKDFLLVGLGGFLGSIGRYGISVMFLKSIPEKTYLSTLTVNLLGSFLIGILIAYTLRLSHSLSLFLAVGFCGGFTTFSTFSMEGIRLIKHGLHGDFLLYASISVIGGLVICSIGYLIGSKL